MDVEFENDIPVEITLFNDSVSECPAFIDVSRERTINADNIMDYKVTVQRFALDSRRIPMFVPYVRTVATTTHTAGIYCHDNGLDPNGTIFAGHSSGALTAELGVNPYDPTTYTPNYLDVGVGYDNENALDYFIGFHGTMRLKSVAQVGGFSEQRYVDFEIGDYMHYVNVNGLTNLQKGLTRENTLTNPYYFYYNKCDFLQLVEETMNNMLQKLKLFVEDSYGTNVDSYYCDGMTDAIFNPELNIPAGKCGLIKVFEDGENGLITINVASNIMVGKSSVYPQYDSDEPWATDLMIKGIVVNQNLHEILNMRYAAYTPVDAYLSPSWAMLKNYKLEITPPTSSIDGIVQFLLPSQHPTTSWLTFFKIVLKSRMIPIVGEISGVQKESQRSENKSDFRDSIITDYLILADKPNDLYDYLIFNPQGSLERWWNLYNSGRSLNKLDVQAYLLSKVGGYEVPVLLPPGGLFEVKLIFRKKNTQIKNN